MRNLKQTALLFGMVILSVLNTTSSSAYEFGVPPITEITDNGTQRGRASLFFLTDSSNYMGLSGVMNYGKPFGGSNYMYRVGTLNYSSSSGTLTKSGSFLGVGKGWEWDLFSDRHIGVITNLQFDYKTWSNSGANSDTGTTMAYGIEIGGLHRTFIEANTLTSFAMLSLASVNDSIKISLPVSGNNTTSLSNQSSSFIIGADYMAGKASLSASIALGAGNTVGSTMALMFAAGYSY
jgi:hypothetical protein